MQASGQFHDPIAPLPRRKTQVVGTEGGLGGRFGEPTNLLHFFENQTPNI
jgi:hypothetical protein